MAAPVILVEAQPRRTSDGATVTVRLAGGGGVLPYRYAGLGWSAGLAGLPTIVASIDFKGDDLGGGGVSQAMVLRWAPTRSDRLAELAAHHWIDAAITVRMGPEGAMPPVLLTGKVLRGTAQGGVLEITLADPAADLKKPVLTERFAGTGGLEGPIEWEDRIKARAWGRVFNLQGDVIDKANNIHCFGDPSRPWQAFDAVRDKGAAAAQIVVLPWQGTAAATFAALQAAAAPQGGGVVCPSIACVKWWTQPAGALCADIRGEIGTGYVETAPEIAQRVAAVVSAVPFAAGTVAAAKAIRNIPVGWFVGDEATTAAQVLDQILGDVSLMWLLGDSEITIRPWTWGVSVVSATSHEVSRRTTFKPVAKRKLGYRKNQHVMSRDAIAGIVLATDVVFDNGESAVDVIGALHDAVDRKTTTFFRAAAPSAAESQENDLWVNTAQGNRIYRRVAGSGALAIGAGRVILAGGGIELCWTEAPDQRIAQALIDAAGAKAIADGKVEAFTMLSAGEPVPVGSGLGDILYRLYVSPPQLDRWNGSAWVPQATYGATAEQAGSIAQSAAAITSILSDAILSRAEKPAFVREWQRAQADYAALVGKAAGFAGVEDEIAALSAAYTALAIAIVALSPPYSDVTQDSAIPDAPALQTKWAAFFSAHAALLMAITAQSLVVQWSVDGATGWHADFTAGDLYQRQSTDGGATWGAPFKAVGEDGVGTPGQDGKFTSFVFKRAATAPDAPTDAATPPAGWSDAPPVQTVPATALWQTSADFRGADRLTLWAAPKKLVPADLEDLDPGAKLILDEAREVAHGKNKTFFRATPPTAAESQEDDIWFNTAEGNFAYRRVAGSGRLAIGGGAITLGGSYVTLCWTPAPDQRIALVVQDVAHTLGIAEEADAKAEAAIGSILTLGDDSKLDPSEKIKTLIPKNAELEAAWAILDAQAGDFGIAAERTAAAAARTAWASYRDGLAPAWDATGFETSIVRATFRTKLGNYEAAIETLKRAISAEAARRAHWSAIVDDNGHRPEPGADVTANAQVSIVPPAQAVVTADYQGTFTTGQFPKVMTPQVARGGASIRAADTTSYALASISAGGTGAVTVNNTNGSADKGRITVTDAMTASFTFTLIITINGIVQAPIPLAVIVERAPPPTGGGGSGGGTGNKSGTDSNFPWLNTNTYIEWSDVFTVDVASGETLRCFAALDYQYQGGAGSGNYVLAVWRYRTSPSGSWIDITGAVAGDNSGVPADPGGGGGLPTPIDPEDPPADPYPGGITCNQNKAGLSAGLYDVALFARLGTIGGGIGVTAGTASVNVST